MFANTPRIRVRPPPSGILPLLERCRALCGGSAWDASPLSFPAARLIRFRLKAVITPSIRPRFPAGQSGVRAELAPDDFQREIQGWGGVRKRPISCWVTSYLGISTLGVPGVLWV